MKTLDVIKELQQVFPSDMFIKEPEDSLVHLLNFEKKYHLNTTDFLNKNYEYIPISEEDTFDWLNYYENFIIFKGNLKNINTVKTSLYDEAYLSTSEYPGHKEDFINNKEEEYTHKRVYSSSLFSFRLKKLYD